MAPHAPKTFTSTFFYLSRLVRLTSIVRKRRVLGFTCKRPRTRNELQKCPRLRPVAYKQVIVCLLTVRRVGFVSDNQHYTRTDLFNIVNQLTIASTCNMWRKIQHPLVFVGQKITLFYYVRRDSDQPTPT